MLVHKNFNEIEAFKCHFCPYQAKYKESLTRHSRIHENCNVVAVHQCPECPHRSKTRSDLKKHLIAHRRTHEAGIFRCSQCSFGTKSKTVLTIHIEKVHKALEQVLKCQHCPYQTRNKGHLKRHMLRHTKKSPDLDGIELGVVDNVFKQPGGNVQALKFSCKRCSYKTANIINLKSHVLTHNASKESPVFRCHHCCLETKSKSNLKKHLRKIQEKQIAVVNAGRDNLLFCEPETAETTPNQAKLLRYEIRMHRCLQCSFETTSKTKLTRHLQGSSSKKTQATFKCRKCSFESKSREVMKTHAIVHKSFDETETFKCLSCPYRTKYKGSIRRHLLTHGNYNEVAIFQCSECPQRSKNKSDLKKHLKTHNRTGETATFKCELCSFSSSSKSVLTIHLEKVHKALENTLNCQQCHYQTKSEKSLKHHELMHEQKNAQIPEMQPESNFVKLNEDIFIPPKTVITYKNSKLWNSPALFDIIQCKNEPEGDFMAPETFAETGKFQCQQCSYETTNHLYYKKHLLIHKSSSNTPVLKCHECCFETRLKSNLKLHLRRMHKKDSIETAP